VSEHPLLSERAQHLLKVLVERYIGEGQPVGSRTLAREAGLKLSPATIRNIMADLEELGLITAPHTSAGRMPTASGYRFFVDTLLTIKPLQPDLIGQLWHDLGNQDTSEDLLETASRLLSEITHMAGLVMLPRRPESIYFRHIEFLPLSEQRVLVILVTNEQEVHNRITYPSRQFSAAELQSAANFLNTNYAGKEMSAIRESLSKDLQEARDRLSQELLNAVELGEWVFSKEAGKRRKPFVLCGEINLLDFSELATTERFRGLFEAFHQKEILVHLLDQCQSASGVKIFIGEESGYRALDQCSLVTASYALNGEAVGVLGVIGPTRMEYERVIPLVDITAKLLGTALNQKSLSPS
jgi:heat-inducible transcriptional repressor